MDDLNPSERIAVACLEVDFLATQNITMRGNVLRRLTGFDSESEYEEMRSGIPFKDRLCEMASGLERELWVESDERVDFFMLRHLDNPESRKKAERFLSIEDDFDGTVLDRLLASEDTEELCKSVMEDGVSEYIILFSMAQAGMFEQRLRATPQELEAKRKFYEKPPALIPTQVGWMIDSLVTKLTTDDLVEGGILPTGRIFTGATLDKDDQGAPTLALYELPIMITIGDEQDRTSSARVFQHFNEVFRVMGDTILAEENTLENVRMGGHKDNGSYDTSLISVDADIAELVAVWSRALVKHMRTLSELDDVELIALLEQFE